MNDHLLSVRIGLLTFTAATVLLSACGGSEAVESGAGHSGSSGSGGSIGNGGPSTASSGSGGAVASAGSSGSAGSGGSAGTPEASDSGRAIYDSSTDGAVLDGTSLDGTSSDAGAKKLATDTAGTT